MRFTILVSLFATTFASLTGYFAPNRDESSHSSSGVSGTKVSFGHSQTSGGSHGSLGASKKGGFSGSSNVGGSFASSGGHSGSLGSSGGHGGSSGAGDYDGSSSSGGFTGGYKGSSSPCPKGEVLNIDRNCRKPEVTKKIFLYHAPKAQIRKVRPIETPVPKLNYNIVFVKTPEHVGGAGSIVVPPPQQKTIVYVLTKDSVAGDQELIEIPDIAHAPEVIFVNYNEGDNPQLPIGIDLQSALSSAHIKEGQIISGNVGIGLIDKRRGGGHSTGAFSGEISGVKFSTASNEGTGGGVSGGIFSGGAQSGGFSTGEVSRVTLHSSGGQSGGLSTGGVSLGGLLSGGISKGGHSQGISSGGFIERGSDGISSVGLSHGGHSGGVSFEKHSQVSTSGFSGGASGGSISLKGLSRGAAKTEVSGGYKGKSQSSASSKGDSKE